MTKPLANPHRPPPRIDWDAARAFYVQLPRPRTYSAVATEFHVSQTSVKKWARRQDWKQVAEDADRQVAAVSLKRAVKAMQDRQNDQLRATERLRKIVLDETVEIDANVAVRALPRYVHYELLIDGQATSRVDLADIQPLLDAFTDAVAELEELASRVDAAAAAGVVGRLDEELQRVASLAAAGAAA